MSNTDWGQLAQNPRVKKARYWLSKTWALLMIIALPGWGMFTAGYWLGINDERGRGAEEITRLQTAYGMRLESLAGKTERAADAVEQAANQVATQASQSNAPAPRNGKPAINAAPSGGAH